MRRLNMAWSYSVFDTVHKPTVKELQEQYIQKGIDSSCAFSMACADYEKSTYHGDRVLHKISDEELKAIPKEFKDKPSGVGRYFWRAPSYQHLEIDGCEGDDPMLCYVQLLLGNLKQGDRLPVRMLPKKPFGYEMEFLTFVKYKHTFPTNRSYIHSETLTFKDSSGKNVYFKRMPTYVFRDKVWETVRRIADILSFWNSCRTSNSEELFGDLFNIIRRERCLSWTRERGLHYHKDFELYPPVVEEPVCVLRSATFRV